jgi:hypothetical protein
MEAKIDTKENPETLGLHCLNGHNIFIKEKGMEMLKCSGRYSICGETKPISEFISGPLFENKPFGVDPTCKACRYARAKSRNNTKKDTNISRLVQDAVNKVLKEKLIDNKSHTNKTISPIEERKNNIKPFTVGEQVAGGFRIRYTKYANGNKVDIHLGSFANDSEEKVIKRAETLKNAFNEILSINNVDFKL